MLVRKEAKNNTVTNPLNTITGWKRLTGTNDAAEETNNFYSTEYSANTGFSVTHTRNTIHLEHEQLQAIMLQ